MKTGDKRKSRKSAPALKPVKAKDGYNDVVKKLRNEITERKKAVHKLKEEMEITSQLLSLSEAVATITDVSRLMYEAITISQRIMHCGIIVSYLFDKQTTAFIPCEQVGVPDDLLPLFKTKQISTEITGLIIKQKKPFIIQLPHCTMEGNPLIPCVKLTEKDMHILSEALDYTVKDFDAFIVVPLLYNDESLGMITCSYNKTKSTVPMFDERYYNAITGMAQQVSVALKQANLYRESKEKAVELAKRVETLDTIHEIDTHILSNLEPKEILNVATKAASRLLSCEVSAILLFDKEKHLFDRIVSIGVDEIPPGTTVPFEDTSLAEVIAAGSTLYIPDLAHTPSLLPNEERLLQNGLLALLRVPLKRDSEVIGVLAFGTRHAYSFAGEDFTTAERFASQISIALTKAKLISNLEELSMETIKSLSNAIDATSEWTAGHSEGVTKLAMAIGRAIKLEENALKDLRVAAMLHDLGKLGIPLDILNKPGALSEDEWSLVRRHPAKGAEILEPIKQLRNILSIVRHHHEFYDGSGYPDGLKGNDIPLPARVLVVADAIDAMSSDRPYRKALSKEQILHELHRCSGTQFDPDIVKVFLSIEDVLETDESGMSV